MSPVEAPTLTAPEESPTPCAAELPLKYPSDVCPETETEDD